MPKRKKKINHSSNKFLTYLAWVLAVIAVVLSALVAGYYLGYNDGKKEVLIQVKKEKQKQLSLLKKSEQKTQVKPKVSVNKRLKEVLKKEVKTYTSASHEYDTSVQVKPPKREVRALKRVSEKPKLAIIIDDVSIRSHVNAIKSLRLPLTMSFLPPSSARPNSAELASKENFYMVHLPMEAMSYRGEEPSTLRIGDSQEKIIARIDEIKKVFPRVRYINNHTGSKFTSNERAMNRLITALNRQKISFIDSRTTAQTKAPKVMKNFAYRYVARDVFLDHHPDKASVKKQIKEAIRIAKLHGTAIAIGHPHANTLLALNESKHLLKDVELVYVNRLY